MREIPVRAWLWYIDNLRKVNDKASSLVQKYLTKNGVPQTRAEINALIDYAYSVSSKYGEASAALAAEMYDRIAKLSNVFVPPAVPAPTPEISEVAKTIVGTLKTENEEIVSSAIGRLVKRTGVDTTMQNALRDGAEWAWIPYGDTCAFCITLASRGWQRASKSAIKNGHAEHIHANCDCTYAVRFDSNTEVEGYNNGKAYLDMYESAVKDEEGYARVFGVKPKDRINALRREFYEDNKERINEQKRSAYAKRKELESSKAEEVDV